MRVMAICAGILALGCGTAAAEFYVVQNIQTRQCSIESEYPVTASAKILVNNKFSQREDAEEAMKNVAVCR
jgi:hypothetical protein